MAGSLKKIRPMYFYTFLLAGAVLVAALPPVFVLGWGYWFVTYWVDSTSLSMLVNALAWVISALMFNRFQRFAQRNPVSFLLPIPLSVYGVLLALLLAFRAPYSFKITLIGFFITVFLLAIQYLLNSRGRQLTLYTVPLGEAVSFSDLNLPHFRFVALTKPKLPRGQVDGVVVDMHSYLMTEEWERFLANCAFKHVPIYNAKQLKETITGRVNVANLIENNFGLLAPSLLNQNLKRVVDLLFLLVFSPVIIPFMAFIALLIVHDSVGGAFYVQRRMGMNGRWFKLYKFRTMYVDRAPSNAHGHDVDPYITKVGRVLRQYRLDELPQFWNVLKGDMSLIGPRPESEPLARWYTKEVPFFTYRHVVRPGISGWAQVMHGYTEGLDQMHDKLEYDFYYIKHFSVWLDLLIWYKTIRTVFTGFGAR
jgi:lipopolysaccharide/colanic/teichoic acid biosynthesis glycosyltransferase